MKLASFLAILIWLIVIVNFFVNLYDLDSPGVGIDDLLHFTGGLWLAGILVYLGFRNWLSIIVVVLVIGIAWEVSEFLVDFYVESKVETMHDGALDTGLDLFFDLAGASIFLLWQRRLSLKAAKN